MDHYLEDSLVDSPDRADSLVPVVSLVWVLAVCPLLVGSHPAWVLVVFLAQAVFPVLADSLVRVDSPDLAAE